MQIVEDAWLSERLGRTAWSVRELDDARSLQEHAEAGGPAFYQARIACDDVEAVRIHAAAGMYPANVVLTLSRTPGGEDPGETDVRTARDGDDELMDLAERAFSSTRFHLDPAVPREAADRIKRDWVGSYLAGQRGERLLVADHGGRPAGFLCVLATRRNGSLLHVIDLIAVAPEARDTGLGRALVRRFLTDAREAGADRVEVGTQAANTRATRFYEGLGFVAERSAYDLHLHT